MAYYKAEILLSCEGFINDNPNEGSNPASFNDCGIIQTITASTIDQLKDKISKAYNLSLFEQFENRLEYSCNEIDNEQIPYLANYSIYLSEVEETEINIYCLISI